MKRVICFIMIIIIVSIPFCVTAYADPALEFIIEFISSFVYDTLGTDRIDDMSPSEIVDYMSSPDGAFYRSVNEFIAKGPIPGGNFIVDCIVDDELNDALNGQYMVSQMNADAIQSLYDTSNGFLEWRDTNIRTNDLSDFGLSTYNEIITGGLYTSGRGPLLYCWNGTPTSIDDGGYFMHAPDDIDDTCVYLYPGSSIYFPVIYVGKNAKIYQNGVALPSGTFYLPLGYNNLICVPNNYGSFRLWYKSGTSIDDITFYYSYILSNKYVSMSNLKIYRDGIDIGITNDAISGFDCVDILQKMVGVHIDPNGDGSFYEPVPVPDDIPYGDDGTVYVFVPIDRPRDIVYMSPETYNNYIDNGNITYDDSITNNVIDSGTVNNITNIYNNYGSGGDFDDSRIVDRLDKIIDKLDVLDDIKTKLNDIYKKIKNLEFPEIEPCYANFSDCITDNVPIAADIKSLVESLNVADANSGFDDYSLNDNSRVPATSGSSSGGEDDIVKSVYSGINVNMGWYAPYREDIRNVLRILCYVIGIGGIWGAVRSVFGIHTGSGGDG